MQHSGFSFKNGKSNPVPVAAATGSAALREQMSQALQNMQNDDGPLDIDVGEGCDVATGGAPAPAGTAPSAARNKTFVVSANGIPQLRTMRALGMPTPLDEPRILRSIAREVWRRAQYCLVPADVRATWAAMGVAARPLEFDGGNVLGPHEAVERFVEIIRRKQGSARADNLMIAIREVQASGEVIETARGRRAGGDSLNDGAEPLGDTSLTSAPLATGKVDLGSSPPMAEAPSVVDRRPTDAPLPLPLPGQVASRAVVDDSSDSTNDGAQLRQHLLRGAALAQERMQSAPGDMPEPIRLSRLGPKPEALLGFGQSDPGSAEDKAAIIAALAAPLAGSPMPLGSRAAEAPRSPVAVAESQADSSGTNKSPKPRRTGKLASPTEGASRRAGLDGARSLDNGRKPQPVGAPKPEIPVQALKHSAAPVEVQSEPDETEVVASCYGARIVRVGPGA